MIQNTIRTDFRDPFMGNDDGVESGESLDELYYRLEGRRLRLLFLEQCGAPRSVLEDERSRSHRIEDAIRVRIRSISVRRDLDERVLLDDSRDDEGASDDSRFERAIETRVHQLACERLDA